MASYSETLDYIFNLRGGKIDLGLERVDRALGLFGHPERGYRSFHVAGTNGKGSTAAILHRILAAQGYRVALYTSPHLVSFSERIRVGEEEISEEEVVELAEEVKARCGQEGIPLTYFEFVTVMAFVHFARRGVDAAVVEVGLGGRLDATNLVVPEVSIITTISKDHEAYLGSDLLSIAREKGGIIKNAAAVVCGSLPPEVGDLFRRLAAAKDSPSYFLGKDFSFAFREGGLFDYNGLDWRLPGLSLGLRGRYQKGNAALALAALEIAARDFPVNETAVRDGLKTVSWPGRLEMVRERPAVILDGAHNGEGVAALVGEMRELAGSRKMKLLFAVMQDKDWTLMLRMLADIVSEVCLTRVPIQRSADPREMQRALGAEIPVTVIEDPAKALRHLLERSGPDDAILVAGSLYLLGQVRPLLAGPAAGRGPVEGFAGIGL